MAPARLTTLLLVSLLLFPFHLTRTAVADSAWRWPVDPPVRVLRGFDPPEERWLPGHLGVDLAAEPGARVRAAGSGHVYFSGRVGGTPLVSVVHDGLRTTYLPVESPLSRGDPVAAGDPLGVLAASPVHCRRRSCLHWGLLRDGTHLDPLGLLGRGRVRLLPLPLHLADEAAPGARPRGTNAERRTRPRKRPTASVPHRPGTIHSSAGMGLAVGVAEAFHGHVRVDLRAARAGVAEELLDAAQVRAAVEQVRGCAVP
ncbi:hypothetical protein HNR10_001962 [Nocardiopsis aegyptia]|uniref:M23ase beta-sheet core domain-containing protein n=1 Tax=Nocardiopsis aegyptia TaxID=220378 RepID=A0A7Z0J9I6_9ACTN|nr:hypothetical protein [Nocardiopsis aegyptia]